MNPKEKENIQEEELQQQAAADKGAEEQANGNATEKEELPVSEEEKLTQELEAANKLIEEQKDKYLRLSAEFDNYRKRTMKEKAELILNGGEKASAAYCRLWMTLNEH